MWDVRACRCCLSTGPDLKLLENPFDYYYTIISSVDVFVGDGYPRYICIECRSRLQTAYEFRKKCHKAFAKMKTIMDTKNEVTLSNIKKIDRRNFRSTLGLWNASTQIFFSLSHLEDENTEQICYFGNERNIMRIIIPTGLSTKQESEDRKFVNTLKDNLFYKDDEGFTISINEYGFVKQLSIETQFLTKNLWIENDVYKLAKFKCDNCHEIFSTLPALIHHNDKHTTLNKQYQCNICQASFKNNFFLTQHKSDFHMWEIACKHCDYVCHVLGVFYNHLKTKHRDIIIYSSGSSDKTTQNVNVNEGKNKNKSLGSSDKTTQNVNVNEGKNKNKSLVFWPRFCLHCNKKLVNAKQYKTHYKKKHPMKPCSRTPLMHYICKSCGVSLTKYDYDSHIKQGPCVPKKMYKCRECDMKSCDLMTIFKHLMLTHEEDPYKCQFCPNLFNRNNSCKKHISTLLLRSVDYKCICGVTYEKYESLIKHQTCHTIMSAATAESVENLSNDKNISQNDLLLAKAIKQNYYHKRKKVIQKSSNPSDVDCTSTPAKMSCKQKNNEKESSNRKKDEGIESVDEDQAREE